MEVRRNLKILITLSIMIGVAVVAVVVYAIVVLYEHANAQECEAIYTSDDVFIAPPPSNSTLGIFSEAAIVGLGAPCAAIGKSMLEAGGNAVDALIATQLCDGVCVMQSLGVGGGFIMTLYNKSEGKVYSLIARETAPAAATEDMYVNHTDSSQFGALAAGVPGVLKGYQEVHERFGQLPWRSLFQPTIKLCEEGFTVNKNLAEAFASKEETLRTSQTFMSLILNSTGGEMPKEGDTLKLPLLAQTLHLIAESPNKAEELYNGNLTAQFVADIQEGGGIITEQDMNNYTVSWEEPYNASLSDGYTLYSSALPGSGILVAYMLRVLDGLLQFSNSDLERSLYVIEAFKHAYGHRSNLGDPRFLNETLLNKIAYDLIDESGILSTRKKIKLGWTSNNISYYGASYSSSDHGTGNDVVVDQEGNAVSCTSTVNLLFGSKFVSRSTGIILNNQMDDFSTPGLVNYFGVEPSEANYIHPGKRPLSSMSPTIVLNREGDVRLVVGAAGGTTITTQVTNVVIRNLFEGMNIKESMDKPRYHHQLVPLHVSYEYGTTRDIVNGWKKAGHSTVRKENKETIAVVTGIARIGQNLTANSDWRKPGSVDGI